MNKNVNACDDFSSFVCDNFDKVYSIQPGEASFSGFTQVGNDITNELKQLLGKDELQRTLLLNNLVHVTWFYLEKQDIRNSSIPQSKAAIFYKSCLNMKKRNIKSKSTIIQHINKITKDKDYIKNLVSLISTGLASRIVSPISFQDPKNPQYNILYVIIIVSK